MIVKRGGKYAVVHCKGGKPGKTIKAFKTRKEAEKMHSAIMARKKRKK